MKRSNIALLVCSMLILFPGCILKEKTLEIVLTQESCADFPEKHLLAAFVTPAVVHLGEEVEDVLNENGVSRADIKKALLVSVSYGVTEFSHGHDWEISGSITVERQDVSKGPSQILTYTKQSIEDALGVMIPAELDTAGVDIFNRALKDFIDGTDPILVFKVNNGSVDPQPNLEDTLAFMWKSCAKIHIVVEQSFEVPDPF